MALSQEHACIGSESDDESIFITQEPSQNHTNLPNNNDKNVDLESFMFTLSDSGNESSDVPFTCSPELNVDVQGGDHTMACVIEKYSPVRSKY